MHHTALRLDFLVNLWYNKNMRHQYWWRLFYGDEFHYPTLFGHPFASEGDLMRHQYWWRLFYGDEFHYPALFGHPFASEGDLMRHQYWWRLFYGRWFPLPHPVRAPLRQRRGFNAAPIPVAFVLWGIVSTTPPCSGTPSPAKGI